MAAAAALMLAATQDSPSRAQESSTSLTRDQDEASAFDRATSPATAAPRGATSVFGNNGERGRDESAVGALEGDNELSL